MSFYTIPGKLQSLCSVLKIDKTGTLTVVEKRVR